MTSKDIKPLTGSPEQIAAGLQGFADQGVGHLQFVLAPTTLRALEEFHKVLEAMDR